MFNKNIEFCISTPSRSLEPATKGSASNMEAEPLKNNHSNHINQSSDTRSPSPRRPACRSFSVGRERAKVREIT